MAATVEIIVTNKKSAKLRKLSIVFELLKLLVRCNLYALWKQFTLLSSLLPKEQVLIVSD